MLTDAIFDLLYLFTVWPLQSNLYCERQLSTGSNVTPSYLSVGYNLLAGKAFFNPLQFLLSVLKLVPKQYFWRTVSELFNSREKISRHCTGYDTI